MCLLIAVACLVLIRTFALEPVRIPTWSMAGTLRPGEHVLVDKATRLVRPWRRGDVVLFRSPGSHQLTIKRLVALSGDTVEIRDGVLHVNGRAVREPYVPPGSIDSVYYGPTRVQAAHVFVLGDNRRNSLDSREYGDVATSALSGRVLAVLWPPREMGSVR